MSSHVRRLACSTGYAGGSWNGMEIYKCVKSCKELDMQRQPHAAGNYNGLVFYIIRVNLFGRYRG